VGRRRRVQATLVSQDNDSGARCCCAWRSLRDARDTQPAGRRPDASSPHEREEAFAAAAGQQNENNVTTPCTCVRVFQRDRLTGTPKSYMFRTARPFGRRHCQYSVLCRPSNWRRMEAHRRRQPSLGRRIIIGLITYCSRPALIRIVSLASCSLHGSAVFWMRFKMNARNVLPS
jgi:hypothetical protein